METNNIQNDTSNHISRFPCREIQYQTICQYIRDDMYPIPSLFIFGGHDTCKTTILKYHLQSGFNAPVSYVHCSSILSEKLLYEKILSQLKSWYEKKPSCSIQINPRCEYLHEFMNKLSDIVQQEIRPIYIVLDDSDILLDHYPALISPFLHLSELLNSKSKHISTILIGRLCWDRYASIVQTGIRPVIVHFPSYSKSELATILSLNSTEIVSLSRENYHQLVEMILHVFYPNCNNLSELQRIISFVYSKYIVPIIDTNCSKLDMTKMFKTINPWLKLANQNYFQFVSFHPKKEISEHDWNYFQVSGIDGLAPMTRYLLIAAYLASYNPSKMDSRLFGDGESLSKRKSKFDQLERKNGQNLIGPKIFSLERMLTIFHNIADETISYQSNMILYTQLATLFEMGLVQRIGPLEKLDEVKCRCKVNLDYIEKISRSVQFDIHSFLLHG